mgnify:CR=1 FL=1
MLPLVWIDESKLGPFHVFGICVAIGLFTWYEVAKRQAQKRGIDDFRALALWVVIGGSVASPLVDRLFYHSGDRAVASTLASMQGFSATGGFIGACLGAVAWRYFFIGKREGRFVVTRRASAPSPLVIVETFVATWPIAFAIGRLGCALVHDHLGVFVPKGTLGSLLAVTWPTGPEDGTHHVLGAVDVLTGASAARFDLGLIECLALAILTAIFVPMYKREVRLGTYTIIATLTYGPVRFLLDFLRAEDGPEGELRHGGLTFAQYFSLAVIAAGVALLVRNLRERRSEVASIATPGP